MRKVRREEILDWVTYQERRDFFRAEALAAKETRRVHLGPNLTFLFENHVTVRYQIQEMMRVEQIVKEADIRHEIETYNELLGEEGELGCTLLIEIDDHAERQVKLQEWRDLPAFIFAVLDDGTRIKAKVDARQVGDTRLSAVQYIRFATEGRVPRALLVCHPTHTLEVTLTDAQRLALAEDLRS